MRIELLLFQNDQLRKRKPLKNKHEYKVINGKHSNNQGPQKISSTVSSGTEDVIGNIYKIMGIIIKWVSVSNIKKVNLGCKKLAVMLSVPLQASLCSATMRASWCPSIQTLIHSYNKTVLRIFLKAYLYRFKLEVVSSTIFYLKPISSYLTKTIFHSTLFLFSTLEFYKEKRKKSQRKYLIHYSLIFS